MSPEDISDKESLQAWLKTQTREVAVTIASRAAMRVAPSFWSFVSPTSTEIDRSAAALARPLLISGIAGTWPTLEIRTAAVNACAANFDSSGEGTAATAAFAACAAVAAETFAADAAKAVADASFAKDPFVGAAYFAFWRQITWDAELLDGQENVRPIQSHPLCLEDNYDSQQRWPTVRQAWSSAGPGWQFWIDWYQAALEGRPLLGDWDRHRDLLTEIALIPDADWTASDEHVNRLIAEIVERHRSKLATPLAGAAVTDFSFDALHRQMKAVGFEDDLAHLRDQKRVQAFLDDIVEVRDGLVDFSDYAADARGRTNAPAVLQRAAEKTLEELRRTKDASHLRARRIVTLGWQLEGFVNEEAKREEIGETLAHMLDEIVALLLEVCRRHLLPSIEAMTALNSLDLGDIDPKDLIARIEAAIGRIERADGTNLVPLRQSDVVMLRDMLDDLRTVEASIGEARTERFADLQRGKLARGGGALSATLGRYVEKGSTYAADAGKAFDSAVKWFRRWETMGDIVDWLDKWFGPGGPAS